MRILYITNLINTGGVARVVTTFAEACIVANRDISIDIVCYEEPSEKIKEWAQHRNISCYVINRITANPFAYIRTMKGILHCNGYDAIHTNIEYFNWIPCMLAKRTGIPVRVGHAHGQTSGRKALMVRVAEYVGRVLNRRYCTSMLACSDPSGKYVFGKGYQFLPNFVNENELNKVSEANKEKYNSEFHINQHNTVLVFVGYMGYEKNPTFAIDLMTSYHKMNPNAVLLMVGEGHELDELKRRVQILEIANCVKFTGYRSDAISIISYADLLIMPSFTEGMSMALIESQMLGTPCVVSPGVPPTNDLNVGLFYRMDSMKIKNWCQRIKEICLTKHNQNEKDDMLKAIINGPNGRIAVTKRLLKIYSGE